MAGLPVVHDGAVGVGSRVLLLAALLSFGAGCSGKQIRLVNAAMSTPAVDVRAVPGGVEVGFVCGPGVPMFSDLAVVDSKGRWLRTVRHVVYPNPAGRTSRSVSTLVLPVPVALRGTPLLADVALYSGRPHGLPIYAFNFRYTALPRHSTQRIAGAAC